MRKRVYKTIIATTLSSILLSGCVATNNQGANPNGMSNTSIGAITGAVLGATVGAATDTKHTSRRRRMTVGAIAGAAVGAAIGYSLDQQAKEVAQVLDTNVNNNPQAERNVHNDLIVSNTDRYVKIMFRDNMMFATNSAVPTPSAQVKINQLAPVLQKYPKTIIQVVGHTDNRGSYDYNLRLSEARANSVRNSIINSEIRNPVYTKGCSYLKPIVPNTNPTNWALNRRVEIYLYPNQQSMIDPCR